MSGRSLCACSLSLSAKIVSDCKSSESLFDGIYRRLTIEIDQHLSITCTAFCDSVDANGISDHTIRRYTNGGPSPISDGIAPAALGEGTKQPLLEWFKTLGKSLLLRAPKPS